jgi:hypothetical protein
MLAVLALRQWFAPAFNALDDRGCECPDDETMSGMS